MSPQCFFYLREMYMFYKVGRYMYRHKGSKDNIDLYKLRLLSMYSYIYIYIYILYTTLEHRS